MNLSKLEYFVSAAEFLSFTKAAKKHYITQTAISQQITSMEKELGVELFYRDKNRIYLSDAGIVFYNEVKSMLRQYEMAVKKAQLSYQKQKKVITIGYSNPEEIRIMLDIIKEFEETNKDIEVIVKQSPIKVLINELDHSQCDLCINSNSKLDGLDTKRFKHYTIYKGVMVLGVGKSHPKAKCEYIDSKELKGEKFIVLNVENSDIGMNTMLDQRMKDGYEFNISNYAWNTDTLMLMVELNRGVAFFQDLAIHKKSDNIVFLPIHNSSLEYTLNLLWNPESTNTHTKALISLIKKRLPRK